MKKLATRSHKYDDYPCLSLNYMNKIGLGLLGLLVLASVAPSVNGGGFSWPDWTNAVKYFDVTGETIPAEDMTVCYVTNSSVLLFFRAEFLGPGFRDLYIYLDTVPNQGQTGTDEGHSLHDLAADYKVYYGSPLAVLYRWDGTSWQFVGGVPFQVPDAYSVELAVNLGDIGNPVFPIGILFISTSPIDRTDWNPDTGHVTYPPRFPVGGVVYQAVTPWLLSILSALGMLSMCAIAFWNLKKKQD